MSAQTEPLREALAEALPERPFRIELWDGTTLPSANGGPTFKLRSPQALGHMLRSPGQLGVGRAYVTGALDIDSVDAALELLDGWSPPPIEPRSKLKIAAAAVRAGALRAVPHVPDAELRPRGRRHSIARDQRSRPPPLRRLERVLRALPRRGDDLLVRDLLARRDDARGGPGGQARARLHQARAAARHAAARRRLRLGELRRPRRDAPRRARHRHHAVRAPGDPGA